MGIKFTGQAEAERIGNAQKARAHKWEYLVTTSLMEAVNFAKENGWEDKKVQVRGLYIGNRLHEYSVEPFESDCSCPDILKFEDYFDRGAS